MEAKEFMIGDWVRLIADGSNECLQVSYVRKDGVGFDQYSHFFDEIEPIHLTEEILVSNGFYNVGKYEWQDEMYVTRYRYRDKEADELFDINYTPDYDGSNVKGFDVNEVHKLQHLLRLANLNELADNFKLN